MLCKGSEQRSPSLLSGWVLFLLDGAAQATTVPAWGKDLEHGRLSSWYSQRAHLEHHWPIFNPT